MSSASYATPTCRSITSLERLCGFQPFLEPDLAKYRGEDSASSGWMQAAMNSDATRDPDQPPAAKPSFVVAYLLWLGILIAIVIAMWLSTGDLTPFRYAGF